MAGVLSRVTTQTGKEILKYPAGLHAIKDVVLDATDFAVTTTDGARYQVPAGTILRISATNTTQYVEYKGTGKIQGILSRSIDLAARATLASVDAAAFFHGAVFATTAIVGFTQYASALVADMPTCKFE